MSPRFTIPEALGIAFLILLSLLIPIYLVNHGLGSLRLGSEVLFGSAVNLLIAAGCYNFGALQRSGSLAEKLTRVLTVLMTLLAVGTIIAVRF